MSNKKNQYKSNARKKNFLKGMNEELPTKSLLGPIRSPNKQEKPIQE